MTLPVELPGSSRKKRKALNFQHVILDLELFESSKNKYPIFNYKDLLKEHLNQSDSSGDDERFHDREAEELVKRLEEKYGKKRDKKGKKIKFGKAEDFIDKSAGYDLTDSFIDDEEAYDELIPSTLDTARKGFYVNRGKLEFKSVYSDEDENASEIDSDDDRPSTSRQPEPKKKKFAKETATEVSDTSAASLNDSIMAVINTSKKQTHVDSALRAAVQSIKKKRLSAGMPPTLRANKGTPPNRQPLKRGPKPKNKNLSVPLASGLTENTAEMASFLAEMAGGNFNAEELENIYRDVNVSPDRLKAKHPANTTATTPPTKRVLIESSDDESSPNTLPVATPERMSGGRPPNAQPVKTPLTWSNELKAMVKHFKDETRKFGAPDNKFRLHPEHVELCIKIEEKCISDGMNMPQKSAVMDSLARWVKIQKQSLYIRMKTYKDRKASGLQSPQKAATSTASSTSSTNKNIAPNVLAVPSGQKTSKSEKPEVKSPKTDKDKPPTFPTTPVRPSAPPPTTTASDVKTEKPSAVDNLIASVVASVAAASSSSKAPDSPSLRSIADVIDAVRAKERKQETTTSTASSSSASRPPTSLQSTSTTKTSAKPVTSAPTKQATNPTNVNKKATTNPPLTSAAAATLSQSLTQDVMTNLALLTAVIKEQMEMQERSFVALTQMAIASNSPKPKKEFIWSDELKKAASTMTSMIIKATAALGQSPNDQATSIVRFFDVSVLPLFGSNGWMTFTKLIAQLQMMVPSSLNLASCIYYRRRVENEAHASKQQSTGQARQATTQQPKKQKTMTKPPEKRTKPLVVALSQKLASSTSTGSIPQATTAASSLSNGSNAAAVQKQAAESSKTASSTADDTQIVTLNDARTKLQANLSQSTSVGSLASTQSSAVRQQNDSQQQQQQLKKQQNDRLKQEQLQKQRLAQEQLKKFQEDQRQLEQRAAQFQLLQLQVQKEQEVQRQVQEQQEMLRRRQQQQEQLQRQQQERQKQQEEQLKQRQLQEQQERQRQAAQQQQQQEEAQKRMLQILEQQRLEQERKKQQELQEKQRLEQERKKQQELQEKQRLEQERRRQQELQEKARLEEERRKQQELQEKQRLEQEQRKQQELQERARLEQERRKQQELQEKQRLEQEQRKQQQEQLKQQQQLQERAMMEQEHRNRLQMQQQMQQQQQQQQLQLQEQRRQQQLQYGSSAGRNQLGSSPGESGGYSQHQLHQSSPVGFPGSPMGMPSSPTVQLHSTPVSQVNRAMMVTEGPGMSPFGSSSSSYSTQPSGAYYGSPQKSHQQQQSVTSSHVPRSPIQSAPSSTNLPMNMQQQLMQLNERGLLNPAEMHQLMSGSMSMNDIQRFIYERCQQSQQSQSGQQHGAFGGGGNFYH